MKKHVRIFLTIICVHWSFWSLGQDTIDYDLAAMRKPIAQATVLTMTLEQVQGDSSGLPAKKAKLLGNTFADKRKKYTTHFYEFSIPQVINGANIDPNPVTSINANFTDSKLSIKLGFPFHQKSKLKDYSKTYFVSFSGKAANGASTLFKSKAPPFEFSVAAGHSRIFRHKTFINPITKKITTEVISWTNLIGSYETTNYNLFDPSMSYGNIKKSKTSENYSLLISYNRYFYSQLPRLRWMNIIYSVGVGVAKTNNYSTLKKRDFEESTMVVNPNNNSIFQSVTETTSGAIGNFEEYEGLAWYVEIFKTILQSPEWGSIYFGNRLTNYSVGQNPINNLSSGFYFNLRNGEKDESKRKDLVGFSITAQFNQINKKDEKDYLDNNYSIVFQAAVPLRFN